MTTPFISRDDLGDYMAQDLTASDAAGICIDAACETVRSYTRRQLNYVEDDEITLNGSGGDTLLLPEHPVIGTPTVLLDDVEVTAFVVQESRLVRNDFGIWDRGVGNVAVTYSHGYVTSEGDVVPVTGPTRVPSDLRDVALVIAAGLMTVSETRFHSQSPRDSVGGSDPTEGPAPVQLSEEQKNVLSSHKNPRVA